MSRKGLCVMFLQDAVDFPCVSMFYSVFSLVIGNRKNAFQIGNICMEEAYRFFKLRIDKLSHEHL